MLAVLAGCGGSSGSSPSAACNGVRRSIPTGDGGVFVLLGRHQNVSKRDVCRTLGPPKSIRHDPRGREVWLYDSQGRVTVTYDNGHVDVTVIR